jgi:hypothetical protein
MTDRAARLEAYFDEAAALFETAVRQAGDGPNRSIELAGHSARLAFAGPALARKILPALRHLPESPASSPELTVALWDLQSTGTALRPPPWDALEYHERGNVRAYDDERFSLNFDRPTDVFCAVDVRRCLALYWTRDADTLPNYDSAAPMRRLFQGWLRTKGQFVVHAAAVGLPGAGLLLAGRGGSGKSTTAMLSLWSDLLYAGDDFSLVQSEPVPYVYSLYNTAKLNVDALDRMPALRSEVSNLDRLDREKALLFLDTSFPGKIAAGFPLRAIVLPRVTGQANSVVTAVSPLAAYRAIGPDTTFRTLGDARGVLSMIKSLVHQLPCYDLALGTDRDGILTALHGMLRHG